MGALIGTRHVGRFEPSMQAQAGRDWAPSSLVNVDSAWGCDAVVVVGAAVIPGRDDGPQDFTSGLDILTLDEKEDEQDEHTRTQPSLSRGVGMSLRTRSKDPLQAHRRFPPEGRTNWGVTGRYAPTRKLSIGEFRPAGAT